MIKPTLNLSFIKVIGNSHTVISIETIKLFRTCVHSKREGCNEGENGKGETSRIC